MSGLGRDESPVPVPYPNSNSPQAWSASATIQLVQILLGLYPFAPLNMLALVRPRLPVGVDSFTIRRMRVGDAVISLRFDRRDDGSASHEILDQTGRLLVIEAPPPQDVHAAGPMDAVKAWAIEHARSVGARPSDRARARAKGVMAVGDGGIGPIGPGTVVVVTGASAGVGRAVVRALGARGASVGLLARGRDGLEGARRDVEEAGGRALAIAVDVADAAGVDRAAERIEAELGPIDIWINNAMTSVFSPVHQMTADEYRRVTEVTYLGTVHGTLSAFRRMRGRDRGVIVQVGSALAYRSIPLQSAYCAAKAAMRGFTASLRSELIHERSGIAVTMVQLPAINTPQFGWVLSRLPQKAQPVPPIFQPEVAAEAILWAAEHVPRELHVGASTELAILGEKVAPGLMDRYLAGAAWDGQMQDEPEEPGRPDNLYQPLPGDRGAHGAFDSRARDRSPYLWLAQHRFADRGVAVALGIVAAIWTMRSRRRH